MKHRFELAYVLSGNVAITALTMGTALVASRFLGPEVRGQVSGTISILSFLSTLLTFGVPQALVPWRGGPGPVRQVVIALVAVGVLAGSVASLGLIAAGRDWVGWAGVAGGMLATSGMIAGSVNAALAQRSGQLSWTFQWVRVLPTLLLLLLMCAFVAAGERRASIWLLAWGGTAAAVSLPQLARTLRRNRAAQGLRPGDAYGDLGVMAFVALSLRSWRVAVGAQVIYRADAVVVALALGAHAVGLYSIAMAAASGAFALGAAVGMQMFSRYDPSQPAEERRSVLRAALARTLLFASAVAVPLAILTAPAIRLTVGEAYVGAVWATRLLVLSAIPLSIDYLLVHLLLKSHQASSAARVQLIIVALTIILLVAAAMTGSINLVAGVSLVAYPVSCILMWRKLVAELGESFLERSVQN